MDTVTARERLEEMRGQIDSSILVLQGEHPAGRAATDSPQDPADAGSTLSETDRTEAALDAVQSQRRLVMDALVRIDRGVYGTCADCGKPIPERPAGCQAGGGPLRELPVQAGPQALSVPAAISRGFHARWGLPACRPGAIGAPGGSGGSLPRASTRDGACRLAGQAPSAPRGLRGVAPPG